MHVIVTAADGGLGSAVTARFTTVGWKVAAVGRSLNSPETGQFPSGNLADEETAAITIGNAAKWLGRVDALVHLAGAFRYAEARDASLADWRAMFESNVASAVVTAKASLQHLAEQSSVTLIGAQSSQPAGAGFGPYGAAKSGVARLTEALAAELRPRRIRVNALLPAIIDTPQNRIDMPDAVYSEWTTPEAIADVIVFLASPAARAINGALLHVTNADASK